MIQRIYSKALFLKENESPAIAAKILKIMNIMREGCLLYTSSSGDKPGTDTAEKNNDTCGNHALEQKIVFGILDLNLPGIDGLEILRQFRTFNTNTPVLILSARVQIQEMCIRDRYS